MKLILVLVLIGSSLFCTAAKVTRNNVHVPLKDTLYIYLDNDDEKINSIQKVFGNLNSVRAYSVLGFIRNNVPKDFIDSLQYVRFGIDLKKDTLSFAMIILAEKILRRR